MAVPLRAVLEGQQELTPGAEASGLATALHDASGDDAVSAALLASQPRHSHCCML